MLQTAFEIHSVERIVNALERIADALERIAENESNSNED